jgi:hypothetical protein
MSKESIFRITTSLSGNYRIPVPRPVDVLKSYKNGSPGENGDYSYEGFDPEKLLISICGSLPSPPLPGD